jgi:hypothetical protein
MRTFECPTCQYDVFFRTSLREQIEARIEETKTDLKQAREAASTDEITHLEGAVNGLSWALSLLTRQKN